MAIPITKPFFGDDELRAVQLPLESGWVVQGPHVAEFERRFASFTGAAHAIAASSCTTAMHMAVAALGLKSSDEVIVPAFTWISSANTIEYLGARPVFCDVDLSTFNLDTAALASLVTERTVGIVPVHLFGLCADMEPVLELARRRGLWVLEDAACGFGAMLAGRHAGTFGTAGAFSFHPRKSITTGEGGMLTTSDANLATLFRSLRDHGASRSDLERHGSAGAFLLSEYPRLGFNFRMTDIQGALGCAQLDRGEWILRERRRVATVYDEALRDVEWLRLPSVPEGYEHGYQAYVCLYAPEEPSFGRVSRLHERRNRLMSRLEQCGIATRQGTHAAALQSFYAERYGIVPADFPNAHVAEQLTISLPLYPQMTAGEQDAVIEAVRREGP